MVQALQKCQLVSAYNCLHWIMYESLLTDSICPIFNISSQIHKGSISWRQQCHKQNAYYRGYQLISLFSSPCNPNLAYPPATPSSFPNIILSYGFFFSLQFPIGSNRIMIIIIKCGKRMSFFGRLVSQLNCLLCLNSIHWPSVSCLQENSKGAVWTHPPLQAADRDKEVIDTFVFTLNHTSKLQLSVKRDSAVFLQTQWSFSIIIRTT